jgi:hypothetical protein
MIFPPSFVSSPPCSRGHQTIPLKDGSYCREFGTTPSGGVAGGPGVARRPPSKSADLPSPPGPLPPAQLCRKVTPCLSETMGTLKVDSLRAEAGQRAPATRNLDLLVEATTSKVVRFLIPEKFPRREGSIRPTSPEFLSKRNIVLLDSDDGESEECNKRRDEQQENLRSRWYRVREPCKKLTSPSFETLHSNPLSPLFNLVIICESVRNMLFFNGSAMRPFGCTVNFRLVLEMFRTGRRVQTQRWTANPGNY